MSQIYNVDDGQYSIPCPLGCLAGIEVSVELTVIIRNQQIIEPPSHSNAWYCCNKLRNVTLTEIEGAIRSRGGIRYLQDHRINGR